ncbi:hypothetical protein M427DRAFT_159981 [Gonapodya prolifera JEL478]|uniref:Uncharacterized protein n=1 Tax=Gonapodya prolifera (strain JEL478) TaxID=1344416 RepID=A0A138ZZQ3_GONPJ|nr:hypothetical protein M427DRAFT_159981 [Gonapodya prolifera JEL478]|eukprot:KXS09980.1 hypothetical protein M427DRAFT_159981 [Gonapodya prolifera JEL478]
MAAIHKIRKLLIVNRGEIAIRLIQTATELGIPTVAVFTSGDDSHAEFATEAVELVPQDLSRVAEAYMDVGNIISIAKRVGADAIHPGYGFLSEQPALPAACREHGILFVGPQEEHIIKFGDKLASKEAARAAGVPVVEGSLGPVRGVSDVREMSAKIGYPVMLKNASGGGGRGIRIVYKDSEIEEAYRRCVGEVVGGAVFLEKAIVGGRHIEVQIIGDGSGNAVHAFERDCSVQRRFQKIVEIAPSPKLEDKIRQRILSDAVKIAKSVNYLNLGTVEFLVDPKTGSHYFLEINPRIQVEHTITEVVTGLDLVRIQLQIAQGQSFSSIGITQSSIAARGFAIQLRVVSEDAEKNFDLQTGNISAVQFAGGHGVRVDTHLNLVRIKSNTIKPVAVGPFFDSLLAKVIAHASTFEFARRKALRCVRETVISGVSSNLPFLENLLQHTAFVEYNIDTKFVENTPELLKPNDLSKRSISGSQMSDEDGVSSVPLRGQTAYPIELRWDTSVSENSTPDYEPHQIAIKTLEPDQIDPSLLRATLDIDGADAEIRIHPTVVLAGADESSADGLLKIAAPHDGLLLSFTVKEGDVVTAGQEVAVLSRMKMETSVRSDKTGVVRKVGSGLVKAGRVIREGMGVVWVEPTKDVVEIQARL